MGHPKANQDRDEWKAMTWKAITEAMKHGGLLEEVLDGRNSGKLIKAQTVDLVCQDKKAVKQMCFERLKIEQYFSISFSITFVFCKTFHKKTWKQHLGFAKIKNNLLCIPKTNKKPDSIFLSLMGVFYI